MTGDGGGKPDKRSINKKPPNPDGKWRRKRYFEKKVVNEKSPDPKGVLEGKLTPYN